MGGGGGGGYGGRGWEVVYVTGLAFFLPFFLSFCIPSASVLHTSIFMYNGHLTNLEWD